MAQPELDYLVVRVPRGRRLKVRIDAVNGLEVLVPAGVALRFAAEAVTELRPWIERELAARDAVRARLREPGVVPFLDERLALVPQEGRTRVHRSGAQLLVPAGDGARGALERWYRRAARHEIGRRLDVVSAASAVPYTRLAIRNQRTRWASCAAGAMSFNWRLLLAPERVLEYVIWHEVCHLEVADHSPRFWRLLESRLPGWREPAHWLRENGTALVL